MIKKYWFIALITILSIFVASTLKAAEGGGEEESNAWKARAEISYVSTSGNSDTQTFAGKLEVKKEGPVHRFYIEGSALFAESDGEETSNRLSFEGRWERVISKRFFGFLSTGYYSDKFSGYNYRLFAGPGAGYDFIKEEKHKLKGLLSIVYYYDDFSEGDKGSDNYPSGKADAKYTWKILDNVLFKQILRYLISFKETDRYFIDSESSIEVKITRMLSLGINYIINYQHLPPSPDIKHTDTTFLTTLIIDF